MNISQLAKHLDVSVTTVSRVLSGNAVKYRISEAMSDRVLKAAEKHRVAPDPLGAGLRSGRLGMIGLLVPDITNPFFSSLARSVERELRKAGMAVLLGDSNEDGETEAAQLTAMLARKLDGLLLVPVGHASDTLDKVIEDATTPLVIIDRIIPGYDVASVSLDNYAGGRLAGEELVRAGHQRIACLRGNPQTYADSERFRGLCDVLTESGLPVDPALMKGAGYTRESGLQLAGKILSRKHSPTAMVTLSGQGILSVLEAASELKVSIPDDLSVIAFDEQPWSSFLQPPLTTIVQPIEEMAQQSVALLQRVVKRVKIKQRHVVLSARLMRRDSVSHVA